MIRKYGLNAFIILVLILFVTWINGNLGNLYAIIWRDDSTEIWNMCNQAKAIQEDNLRYRDMELINFIRQNFLIDGHPIDIPREFNSYHDVSLEVTRLFNILLENSSRVSTIFGYNQDSFVELLWNTYWEYKSHVQFFQVVTYKVGAIITHIPNDHISFTEYSDLIGYSDKVSHIYALLSILPGTIPASCL